MQSLISSRAGPFGRKDIEKLEDLFVFARGQPISLTTAASEAYTMWRLWKKGIKPWEYLMSYENGNPIVYKDDIDLLLFVDSLNERGISHEEKKQEKIKEMQERMHRR